MLASQPSWCLKACQFESNLEARHVETVKNLAYDPARSPGIEADMVHALELINCSSAEDGCAVWRSVVKPQKNMMPNQRRSACLRDGREEFDGQRLGH